MTIIRKKQGVCHFVISVKISFDFKMLNSNMPFRPVQGCNLVTFFAHGISFKSFQSFSTLHANTRHISRHPRGRVAAVTNIAGIHEKTASYPGKEAKVIFPACR
jgi:hypothetical protein